MTRLRRLLLSASVLCALAAGTGVATWAAFSAVSANSANSFATGTVALTDNDGNGTLVSLTGAQPGTTATGCIKVTYSGSLAAGVKLFAATSGTLAQYLTLKVTRGSDPTDNFPSCDGFTADNRNYVGQGPGVIYSGNLSSFPSSYATGITDLEDSTGGAETWTTSEAHAYKLEVTLQSNSSAQGQSANASFTWEARNQ